MGGVDSHPDLGYSHFYHDVTHEMRPIYRQAMLDPTSHFPDPYNAT